MQNRLEGTPYQGMRFDWFVRVMSHHSFATSCTQKVCTQSDKKVCNKKKCKEQTLR